MAQTPARRSAAATPPPDPSLPPQPQRPAPPGIFSAEQIASLSAPLDGDKVRTLQQGRSSVSYMEAWQLIAEANRIFGFDGWQRETVSLACLSSTGRSIGRDAKPGWGVTYAARVRITVGAGTGLVPVIREGSGAGHGIDVDLGQAHELALKSAETDAMKRALMTFGNPFGLALYDKQQREVTQSTEETPAQSGGWQLPGQAAAAPLPPAGPTARTGLQPWEQSPEQNDYDLTRAYSPEQIAAAAAQSQQVWAAQSGTQRTEPLALPTQPPQFAPQVLSNDLPY